MKSWKKITAAVAATALSLAVVAGCTSTSASSASGDSTSSTASSSEAATRTVIDQFGHKVELAAEVDGICGSFPAVDYLFALEGAGDKICAVSAYSQDNEWFLRMVPGAADLPTPFANRQTGNLEELMDVHPDAVIVYSEDDYEELTAAGLSAVRVFADDVDGVLEYISLVGEVLGGDNQKRAEKLRAYYEDNIALMNERTAGLADADRPTVFYSAGSTTTTEGLGSIMDESIELAGGINIAAANGVEGSFVDISSEDLMEWNPDFIICRDYATVADYQSDPALSQLDAVKNGNIAVYPGSVFGFPIYNVMNLWLSTVILPEQFSDIDMVEVCRDFHKEFCGIILTDAEVEEILHPTK